MKRSLPIALFILMSGGLFAQRTGTVRLVIDPGHNFSFVLDGKYRMEQREVTLTEGPHQFTFWAPERSMTQATVIVVGDSVTSFFLRLPYSPEYQAYQRELSQFKGRMFVQRIIPAVVTVGLGVWSVTSYTKYRDAHQQLVDDEASYATLTVPREISQLKNSTIPDDKDAFTKARTNFYISTGLFALSAATTAYLFHRTAHRAVPVFEDKEKVRFDGLVWVPTLDSGGTWAAGLTIPIR